MYQYWVDSTSLPARPILILLPVNLITQWIKAIERVAPGFFLVYKYYGDGRPTRMKPVADEVVVSGNLHRGHELLDGKPQRARSIIITSYATFAERHGPKALRKYRTNTLNWSKTKADKMETINDADWKGNLEGQFGTVICDEAHGIKSLAANGSTAVSWLKANFHVLITGSPIPNGIHDFLGYMPLLEPHDAEELWSPNRLLDMGFEEDENPFELPDDHPATRLQMTTKAVKEWCMRPSIEPVTRGAWLRKIWKKILIRRTFHSCIPFENGDRLGDSIPKVKAALLNCQYTDDERKHYAHLNDDITGKLISLGSLEKKRPRWNLAMHRRLSMLTVWLKLPELDDKVNLKASNIKKTLERQNFYYDWFRGKFPDPSTTHPSELLRLIAYGGPKVRALLKNIRSQVSCPPPAKGFYCRLLQQGYCNRLLQQAFATGAVLIVL